MSRFDDKLASYADYHRDARNKLTHFFGVPIVTFAVFQALAWFRFTLVPQPVSLAMVFFVGVGLYYLRLDAMIGLLQLPFTLALLLGAEWAAHLGPGPSIAIFAATAFVGVVVQGLGHVFEGRKPALVDNFSQVFNAPLFLVCEIVFALGLRAEQRHRLESALAAMASARRPT